MTVYCPIVEAEDFVTFDVKLDRLLRIKRELARDMLNGSGDVLPGEFSLDDMDPGGYRGAGAISPPLTIDDVAAMQWEHFEYFVVALWLKKGFRIAYKTPRHDGGIDVVAISGNSGVLIQCKTSGADGRQLGWEAVKDVVAGEAAYRKAHPGVAFRRLCVTNQYFNSAAKEQASINDVELVDRDVLADLLRRHSVRTLDVDRMRYRTWDESH